MRLLDFQVVEALTEVRPESAIAQDKHVFQMICGKPFNAHSIDVGDRPDHSYKVSQTMCTAAKGEVGE